MLHIAPGCLYGGCLHGHLLCQVRCLAQALLHALDMSQSMAIELSQDMPQA